MRVETASGLRPKTICGSKPCSPMRPSLPAGRSAKCGTPSDFHRGYSASSFRDPPSRLYFGTISSHLRGQTMTGNGDVAHPHAVLSEGFYGSERYCAELAVAQAN